MNKLVVGITGEIGCGKSYIASTFINLASQEGIAVTNIDLDLMAHDILNNDEVIKERIRSVWNTCDRKELSRIVFSNPNDRHTLNGIMLPAMVKETQNRIEQSQGIILVNGALIVETPEIFRELCKCQTIVVLCPANTQLENLTNRGYSLDNSLQRVFSQLSTIQKIIWAKKYIEEFHVGFVDYIHNYRGDEKIQVLNLLHKYNEKLKTDIHC